MLMSGIVLHAVPDYNIFCKYERMLFYDFHKKPDDIKLTHIWNG